MKIKRTKDKGFVLHFAVEVDLQANGKIAAYEVGCSEDISPATTIVELVQKMIDAGDQKNSELKKIIKQLRRAANLVEEYMEEAQCLNIV